MSQTITLEKTGPEAAQLKPLSVDQQIEAIIKKDTKSAYVHSQSTLSKGVPTGGDPRGLKILPETTRKRFEEAGIDLSKGYPYVPNKNDIPIFLDEATKIRNDGFPFVERGVNADPEKKAFFGAAKQVINLTTKVGTEIVGLQLSDLTDQQKDELALLVAERVVVFFRDQKLSPQKQLELGQYWGQVELHPQSPRVPGLPGVGVIWQNYSLGHLSFKNNTFGNFGIRDAVYGSQTWHTDLVHEFQPAGITHLHNDAIPELGGDTIWSSGYAAYDKLSPALQKFLDGKEAIYFSAHGYIDRDDPFSGPKKIERRHPIIRTHPSTGWKALFVNRSMTKSIVGLEPPESSVILNYLLDVLEKNADIQVRFNWKPTKPGYGTSAIWDNRVSVHSTVWDYEGLEPRHGTRVTSLAEVPFFDAESKSQREALGLSLD
ncbi:TauD/TfdA dioxygenase family protein [Ascoidea rubescens DSM 1968]|uniref:Taurine catabolism dioxygenase n=1 Tax=Ascoidea rubescens DSM 1968 TaxID=1344418 RepID=A0A1D2VBV3_9ASCO|nr:taurine catabolism dioxygenase [Ascoidea rubescens DSM 1968]ODV58947.1 taurine catabolism dioxygenase [Ascoidea rubescens DSM 1968]